MLDMIENLLDIYSNKIPAFLYEIADSPQMLRLKGIGMNCGCEYTSFPLFKGLEPYSRFTHSLGVGAIVWNLNDFYSEARRNAMPHVNNKGLVSTDRERKDGYYLYQAYLKESPVLHIASKSWKNRAGASRDGKSCTQPLKVYTNADKVEVFLNGKSLGVYL